MFSVPKRRRYTWKAPGDTARYQIDYILVKRKHRNNIRSSHAYPGSQIDSDHVLVKAKCNIRFKKHVLVTKKNWCLSKLKDEKKVTDFHKVLEDRMREKGAESWEDIKANINFSTEKVLGKNVLEPKKPWMTQGILELIKERNKLRNENHEKYKEVKNKITSECKKAKDEWMKETSKEIEHLLSKNYADKAYTKVKSLENKTKTRSNIVKDKEGKLLF